MLILTRRINERIYIGNDICITLLAIRGGQVRLGFDAPDNVSIIREELLDIVTTKNDGVVYERN
jgi:carbon storage regulator